ncbi:MAG TPA: imidazole glycerol phosphate synthase subunit HisH [Aggregatilineales bacterium]|nr:imidazole glycerol phosphate synthase subunit HisH [Aggregatilineales bacterium]
MTQPVKAAIVDYGLGNLWSVKHACQHTGMEGNITDDPNAVSNADVVILPGVGAFGDAMNELRRRDLVTPIHDFAQSGKPLIGICLGLQLLMEESHEFGSHNGLGLIEGEVLPFENLGVVRGLPTDSKVRPYKVPQVGWNHVRRNQLSWNDTPLEGVSDGEFMYFVHSFYVKPSDERLILSCSMYGNIEFCSSVRQGNIFACQFHPERSGENGLRIYENIAAIVRNHNND